MNNDRTKRMIRVVSVDREGNMTIHERKVKLPAQDLKIRHHLRIPADKQEEFWKFSKAIEEKVKKHKAMQEENRKLKALNNKRALTTVDNWFKHAIITKE